MHPDNLTLRAALYAKSGASVLITGASLSGKTAALTFIANEMPEELNGLYLCSQETLTHSLIEAMPEHVHCNTLREQAALSPLFLYFEERLCEQFDPAWVSRVLNLPLNTIIDEVTVSQRILAQLTIETVQQFCLSCGVALHSHHVVIPEAVTVNPERVERLTAVIYQHALSLWHAVIQPDSESAIPWSVFLKLWSLKEPHLKVDYVLYDDAEVMPGCLETFLGQSGLQVIATSHSSRSLPIEPLVAQFSSVVGLA